MNDDDSVLSSKDDGTWTRAEVRGKEGIALVRGHDGTVRRMIWNEAGMSVGPGDEASFLALVRTSDAEGIARLLEATHSAAFVGSLDIDLGLVAGDRRVQAGLFACRFGPENLLLVGASDRALMVRLFEPLMEMAFEDGTHLRALLCEARDHLSAAEARNRILSNEVSALRLEVERLRASGGLGAFGAREEGKRGPRRRGLGLARRLTGGEDP